MKLEFKLRQLGSRIYVLISTHGYRMNQQGGNRPGVLRKKVRQKYSLCLIKANNFKEQSPLFNFTSLLCSFVIKILIHYLSVTLSKCVPNTTNVCEGLWRNQSKRTILYVQVHKAEREEKRNKRQNRSTLKVHEQKEQAVI